MTYPYFNQPTDTFQHVYGGVQNVGQDDIVHGLYLWLIQKPDLMELLGHLPGPEPYTPMLFEYEIQGVVMMGKQTNAVVIRYGGGWSAPNYYNTLKFPKVLLDFYVDPLRNENHDIVDRYEVNRRIMYIYEKFDRYMHRPAAIPPSTDKTEMWGTVRTTDSTRLGEFSYDPVPEQDGLILGQAAYGVVVG